MNQLRVALAYGLIVISVGSVGPIVGASAQAPAPNAADAPVPPPVGAAPLSSATIIYQMDLGIWRLQQARDMLSNGSIESPQATTKAIFDGYVRIRHAHALLTRRMRHHEEKTKTPNPMLALASKQIQGARFKVLHARDAAARSRTERSLELLDAAIPEFQRAKTLIE